MATYKYTKLNRRGYEIVLPTSVYNELRDNKVSIGLVVKGNSKTVQLIKDRTYAGTLKEAMGVKSFKDGDACNFRVSNLIEVED